VFRSSLREPLDLPAGVPYAADIAPSERDRDIVRLLTAAGELGRPFIASASMPAERVELLRRAFDATVADEDFIADARRLRMPVSPKSGEDALRTVAGIHATPDDIVLAARKIAGE
jgi:hypothetical protein